MAFLLLLSYVNDLWILNTNIEVAPRPASTDRTQDNTCNDLKKSRPFLESTLICKNMTIQKNEAIKAIFTVLALLILLVIFLRPKSLCIIHIKALIYS